MLFSLMIAFHTSLANFAAFDAAFIGSSSGHTGCCHGFYFSNDSAHSSHKAEGEESWITYQVELDIANPATSKGYSETMDTWGDDPTEAMNNLIAAGHDALIMAGGDEIVVWDTSKIKIISKQ